MSSSTEEYRRTMLDSQLDALDRIEQNLMAWRGNRATGVVSALRNLTVVLEAQTRVQLAAARIAAIGQEVQRS